MKTFNGKTYKLYPGEFPLPMLLDGATGTSLMRLGMPEGVCTEEWVLEHKEEFLSVRRGYVDAGSDAVYCPTFGANAPSLGRFGVTRPVGEMNAALAALPRLGENGRPLLGGDMSPTGLFMAPMGEATFEQICDIYAEQAAGMNEHVDFFVVETMISLAEARAALLGIKRVSDKPVFVTLTVNENGRTMCGDALLPSLLTLASAGAAAFGCNCSVGPAQMLRMLAPLCPYADALGLPLIAKPNAGMPCEHEDGSCTFDLSAEDFAAFAPEFLRDGICILGGCCGSDRDYISALRGAIDSFPAEQIGSREAEQLSDEVSPEDIARAICDSRSVVLPDGSAEALAVTDDNIYDGDDGSGYMLFRVENESDAEHLCESFPFISVPIALCGDQAACESVALRYCGKTVILP